MYVKKPASTAIDPVLSRNTSSQEEFRSYTSDSYQKILDYHVVEILLTTVVFGVIVLLRLHH